MAVTNMRLKLLIDTKNRKVLFAEADKDFVDFLFHILRLPLGTIIPLLKKQGTVGSFENIYDSIENLSTTYLQPNVNKETLLKHKVHISSGTGEVPLLLPDIESSPTSRKFFRCSRLQNNNCYGYVADDGSALCPSCQVSMTRDLSFVDPLTSDNSVSSGGGYVKGVVTYMIMDDLEVKPMSTISSITLLNKLNVKQLGDLEEKVVELGMDETESMEETNVSLKLLINRESQRVLYAEAGKDFIDFLFHILVFPVGSYIPLLKKQEMVGSFHNIYESIENLSSAYLQPNANKETILNPKVHIADGTGDDVPLLLPNIESSTSAKFYRCASSSHGCDEYVAYDFSAICPSCEGAMNCEVSFVDLPSATNKDSFSESGYVKGLVSYMVMDDLEVKPMSIISSTITLLNRFNVKETAALEEKVVYLGMDEGVKLLKASLQSKTVLTDVFLPKIRVETYGSE
ncbi:uncharacterized protein LOC112000069 [Quercus suber]|uniref:uncharacterized protein LOC112000069 n=1 Tax=Quercus suber TaxID=58331 RepID=UPI0032DE6825